MCYGCRKWTHRRIPCRSGIDRDLYRFWVRTNAKPDWKCYKCVAKRELATKAYSAAQTRVEAFRVAAEQAAAVRVAAELAAAERVAAELVAAERVAEPEQIDDVFESAPDPVRMMMDVREMVGAMTSDVLELAPCDVREMAFEDIVLATIHQRKLLANAKKWYVSINIFIIFRIVDLVNCLFINLYILLYFELSIL